VGAGGRLEIFPTIPVGKPARQIDYVLFRPARRWRTREVQVLDEVVASDHRAILAVIELVSQRDWVRSPVSWRASLQRRARGRAAARCLRTSSASRSSRDASAAFRRSSDSFSRNLHLAPAGEMNVVVLEREGVNFERLRFAIGVREWRD
jgi:hypothetical protein